MLLVILFLDLDLQDTMTRSIFPVHFLFLEQLCVVVVWRGGGVVVGFVGLIVVVVWLNIEVLRKRSKTFYLNLPERFTIFA